MGALWMGIAAWVKAAQATDASAEDKAQLEKFVKLLRAQHQYPNLMSLIVGKRYAVVNDQLTAVTIKDGQYTKTVQFEYNARPLAGAPEDDGFTESGNNSGTTESGNQGNTDGGSVDPNPANPETPAAGESFTIAAGVSADGGGSISIKKNGAAVSGNSVQASASDTVVLTAVEDDGYQFLGWSDGNSQNPRTIQPSADMNVEASFMDLSKI